MLLETSISLDVHDFEDSASTGTATPRPPTPTPPPPRTPPPVRKTKPLELPLDDDDLERVALGPTRATSLVAFELGSKQDDSPGLDSLHFTPIRSEYTPSSLPPLTSPSKRKKRTMTQLSGTEQTTEAQLKEYTTAEVYDKNQKLFDDSIPDVPLVSSLSPMAALRAEYENGSASFVSQIDWLVGQGYTGVRRARGDGDCFYRSLAFAYIDQLLHSSPGKLELNVASSLSVLQTTQNDILVSGTERFILEEPYEMITSIIQNITTPNRKGQKLNEERLLARFQTQGSDSADEEDEPVPAYIVYYLRMITSAHLKNNHEEYSGFFYDADRDILMTPEEFCTRFVDPVGVEADHVQMLALCRELKVNLNVAYLDGHKSDIVDFVTFEEGPEDQEPITLLYRPGHYDILVKGEN